MSKKIKKTVLATGVGLMAAATAVGNLSYVSAAEDTNTETQTQYPAPQTAEEAKTQLDQAKKDLDKA